ncbi:hypothetical protein OTU49_014722, partial [Cherax quadricarinatus]
QRNKDNSESSSPNQITEDLKPEDFPDRHKYPVVQVPTVVQTELITPETEDKLINSSIDISNSSLGVNHSQDLKLSVPYNELKFIDGSSNLSTRWFKQTKNHAINNQKDIYNIELPNLKVSISNISKEESSYFTDSSFSSSKKETISVTEAVPERSEVKSALELNTTVISSAETSTSILDTKSVEKKSEEKSVIVAKPLSESVEQSVSYTKTVELSREENSVSDKNTGQIRSEKKNALNHKLISLKNKEIYTEADLKLNIFTSKEKSTLGPKPVIISKSEEKPDTDHKPPVSRSTEILAAVYSKPLASSEEKPLSYSEPVALSKEKSVLNPELIASSEKKTVPNTKTDVLSDEKCLLDTKLVAISENPVPHTEIVALSTEKLIQDTECVSSEEKPGSHTETIVTSKEKSILDTEFVASSEEKPTPSTDTVVASKEKSVLDTEHVVSSEEKTVHYTETDVLDNEKSILDSELVSSSEKERFPNTEIVVTSKEKSILDTELLASSEEKAVPNTAVASKEENILDTELVALGEEKPTPSTETVVSSKEKSILDTELVVSSDEKPVPSTETVVTGKEKSILDTELVSRNNQESYPDIDICTSEEKVISDIKSVISSEQKLLPDTNSTAVCEETFDPDNEPVTFSEEKSVLDIKPVSPSGEKLISYGKPVKLGDEKSALGTTPVESREANIVADIKPIALREEKSNQDTEPLTFNEEKSVLDTKPETLGKEKSVPSTKPVISGEEDTLQNTNPVTSSEKKSVPDTTPVEEKSDSDAKSHPDAKSDADSKFIAINEGKSISVTKPVTLYEDKSEPYTKSVAHKDEYDLETKPDEINDDKINQDTSLLLNKDISDLDIKPITLNKEKAVSTSDKTFEPDSKPIASGEDKSEPKTKHIALVEEIFDPERESASSEDKSALDTTHGLGEEVSEPDNEFDGSSEVKLVTNIKHISSEESVLDTKPFKLSKEKLALDTKIVTLAKEKSVPVTKLFVASEDICDPEKKLINFSKGSPVSKTKTFVTGKKQSDPQIELDTRSKDITFKHFVKSKDKFDPETNLVTLSKEKLKPHIISITLSEEKSDSSDSKILSLDIKSVAVGEERADSERGFFTSSKERSDPDTEPVWLDDKTSVPYPKYIISSEESIDTELLKLSEGTCGDLGEGKSIQDTKPFISLEKKSGTESIPVTISEKKYTPDTKPDHYLSGEKSAFDHEPTTSGNEKIADVTRPIVPRRKDDCTLDCKPDHSISKENLVSFQKPVLSVSEAKCTVSYIPALLRSEEQSSESSLDPAPYNLTKAKEERTSKETSNLIICKEQPTVETRSFDISNTANSFSELKNRESRTEGLKTFQPIIEEGPSSNLKSVDCNLEFISEAEIAEDNHKVISTLESGTTEHTCKSKSTSNLETQTTDSRTEVESNIGLRANELESTEYAGLKTKVKETECEVLTTFESKGSESVSKIGSAFEFKVSEANANVKTSSCEADKVRSSLRYTASEEVDIETKGESTEVESNIKEGEKEIATESNLGSEDISGTRVTQPKIHKKEIVLNSLGSVGNFALEVSKACIVSEKHQVSHTNVVNNKDVPLDLRPCVLSPDLISSVNIIHSVSEEKLAQESSGNQEVCHPLGAKPQTLVNPDQKLQDQSALSNIKDESLDRGNTAQESKTGVFESERERDPGTSEKVLVTEFSTTNKPEADCPTKTEDTLLNREIVSSGIVNKILSTLPNEKSYKENTPALLCVKDIHSDSETKDLREREEKPTGSQKLCTDEFFLTKLSATVIIDTLGCATPVIKTVAHDQEANIEPNIKQSKIVTSPIDVENRIPLKSERTEELLSTQRNSLDIQDSNIHTPYLFSGASQKIGQDITHELCKKEIVTNIFSSSKESDTIFSRDQFTSCSTSAVEQEAKPSTYASQPEVPCEKSVSSCLVSPKESEHLISLATATVQDNRNSIQGQQYINTQSTKEGDSLIDSSQTIKEEVYPDRLITAQEHLHPVNFLTATKKQYPVDSSKAVCVNSKSLKNTEVHSHSVKSATVQSVALSTAVTTADIHLDRNTELEPFVSAVITKHLGSCPAVSAVASKTEISQFEILTSKHLEAKTTETESSLNLGGVTTEREVCSSDSSSAIRTKSGPAFDTAVSNTEVCSVVSSVFCPLETAVTKTDVLPVGITTNPKGCTVNSTTITKESLSFKSTKSEICTAGSTEVTKTTFSQLDSRGDRIVSLSSVPSTQVAEAEVFPLVNTVSTRENTSSVPNVLCTEETKDSVIKRSKDISHVNREPADEFSYKVNVSEVDAEDGLDSNFAAQGSVSNSVRKDWPKPCIASAVDKAFDTQALYKESEYPNTNYYKEVTSHLNIALVKEDFSYIGELNPQKNLQQAYYPTTEIKRESENKSPDSEKGIFKGSGERTQEIESEDKESIDLHRAVNKNIKKLKEISSLVYQELDSVRTKVFERATPPDSSVTAADFSLGHCSGISLISE